MTAVLRRAGMPDLVVPDESTEQRGHVARMAVLARSRYPALETLHSVPNGGARHPAEAAILKAEGVRAGYPDLALDAPSLGYHGLRIELKRSAFGMAGGYTRFGGIALEQLHWLMRLSRAGYYATVCRGGRHADETTIAYLEGDAGELARLDGWWRDVDLPRYIKVPKKAKRAARPATRRAPSAPGARRPRRR